MATLLPNGVRAKHHLKSGDAVAVCVCPTYDGEAGETGGQAKSYYKVMEAAEIPHIASCTGLEMVWTGGQHSMG